ncbi:centrosomal protein of 126 kDa isoform X2 [Austrofundulus limnaeus]|uniref:Centrosomal protein of 126 kDa isoform X2 n=1 Tax=Austrofundulus limnaeus TaxID=52670 RepID=A0A2I4BKG5_AUSLI|nr:PREDICTED: centrosomal protein of 126 kDa isoform X2 [Austrofundulus limnaeus]
MHVFHKNSSYLSNFRLETGGNLEHERQSLVQEQKLCKTRARKFSLETNRRRKALDERRKLWDVQEKRLRENILQQRKQQVQEATERFQRAHLPPQRYRPSLRRDAPNIEDALDQIHGNLSSHGQQSSLSSTTNISSSTPSPAPPTAPKFSHGQALSAVEAYVNLLQEQCGVETLQHLQGSHDSDCCISESLSSKDSLEDEDSNQNPSSLHPCSSLFLLDSKKAHSQQKQRDLCPTSFSFSAMMLLDENLTQLRKLHEPKRAKQEDSDWANNGTVVSEALWDFTSMEKTPKTEKCPTLHNTDLVAPCKLPKEDQDYYEVKFLQNNRDSNLVTNRVVLGNPDESPYSKPEAPLNLREQRILHDGQLKYLSSSDTPFPSKNSSSKGIHFENPPKNNADDDVTNNRVLLPTEKENYVSSRKMPCASINDLNKVSNSECKTEKAVNAESLSNTSWSMVPSERHASPEEAKTNVPVSAATPPSVCKVKVIKGILKKQSKSMPRDTSCTRGSDYMSFAKHVALALRDSVELTRAKNKDVHVSSTVRKKLRWFDEVRLGEDHQPSLTEGLRSPKPGPNMTPASSTGYHFTKEAWADVGVQVNLPQEQADGVEVAHSSAKNSGGPRVPQRARSSRGGGPVFLRTRRGTVIRPQSATEVSQIAKTRGGIMPRPPPRTEKTLHVVRTPSGLNPAGFKHKQALVMEEALPKNNSGRIFSPKAHDVITTDSTVVYTTLPHCFLSEGNTKGVPISGHQEFHHNSGRLSVFREKGLCLDVTPTDEEISQLWHGVRSALNTKDDKTTLKRQALEGRQASQKASSGQGRQPPGSANRRLLQTSQPAKQITELLRACPSTHYTNLNEGFETTAQSALEGLLKGSQAGGAMEVPQTPGPGREQRQEITTISLEEKKILLSLEKLNQQLSYFQEHRGHDGARGLTIIDAPFTKEMKGTNYSKHRPVLYHKKV